ncbi:sodium-dependent bicarbonate transport family permease [Aquirufa nivalisilvae]|uniref:Sodium-dependent bicarbonate transport family permease n=1 Tax=Aquirufa aurantiipilula TaxID=2696561 RepID=A0ABT6BIP2_9BACT|nr:sodium-dependent bicarbonate transport family permease [Aquirufa aurantiipilula]MBZ1326868.1 sodium-dependent bicarbonate transport family permease [Aquirufa aurantiipilula]MCZ2479592.1 sodium-dependent bicarbonate transport family permease [Aquirufa nivalisilvae]MCZ2481582.1 sodium-dependent bicarbonate transport family permease [Aquirufa nivalisilvae]MDF5690337.1 sodium-dependent bicarbonate transport family permease [Aquirufa aurantiipilula]
MNFELLIFNLTNPTLLFFILGMLAKFLKSDLEVPAASKSFIALYLLFSIGFNGGTELAATGITGEIVKSLVFGLCLASVIPIYAFFILRTKLNSYNAGAIAASYGSVSAVTFVSAVAFLEMNQMKFGGEMVAVMASMEFPAIIMGLLLMSLFPSEQQVEQREKFQWKKTIHHSLTNGSVLMILGSLLIGFVSDSNQTAGIKHFTSDIFKGFLAIFLLDMGMVAASRISAFRQQGYFVLFFAILLPLFNGCLVAYISQFITDNPGNRLIFAILAASASYIAVPAAMRMVAPKADPGIYIPMALGVTFPFNITIGMPIFFQLIQG